MAAASRSVNLTTSQSRALVEKITDDHGFVSEEDLASMRPEVRDRVRRAMFNKDQMIASSVVTLARNLYTSKARFVFELLQNADDNSYDQARVEGNEPYVSFLVHPTHIIIECNEDGFTKENLIAICNVGKSSKTGSQVYTGEKGIGFKSVFMVAWKVHIQSRNFSFFFQHRSGDSGMGMISPIWQETSERLAQPLTRITLHLTETINTAYIQGDSDPIIKQFHDLEDTLLLFLRNLKRIVVRFFDTDGNCIIDRFYSKVQQDQRGIVRLVRHEGGRQVNESHFMVFKSSTNDLPRSENRTYSEDEVRSAAWRVSQIVLAFPVTKDHVPIESSQDIFAFLPLHNSKGFKFLIQADFVTQANRQDIVTTSARNIALLKWIARVFVKAVMDLCDHPTLQYQWMRYLPQDKDFPWDDYWRSLVSQIKSLLSRAPVLRPRSHKDLKFIRDLRRCANDALDKEGDPLFRDIKPEQYISKKYQNSDLDKLDDYGLRYLTLPQHIERLSQDLESSSSKMKSTDTDYDWHSRAARLLCKPFENDWSCKATLQKLKLVPIHGIFMTLWDDASTESSPIYFPDVDGITIPNGLPLRVVTGFAAEHPERKKLYHYLGVREASVETVRVLIIQEFSRNSIHSASTCLECLRFLYLTHRGPNLTRQDYIAVYTIADDGRRINPGVTDVYLVDDSPYGAYQLLKPIPTLSFNGDGKKDETDAASKGFHVEFLSQYYLDSAPNGSAHHSISWRDWLHDFVGIRRRLRVVNDGMMSPAFQYIAKYRPNKFVETLQFFWEYEEDNFLSAMDLFDEIRFTEVPTEAGSHELYGTYLPLQELKDKCSRFAGKDNILPFLVFNDHITQSNIKEWEFLDNFGVRMQIDMNFYLELLEGIQQDFDNDCTREIQYQRMKGVCDLYQSIQGFCISAELAVRQTYLTKVRLLFREPMVIIPEDRACSWVDPSKCRWDAPSDMLTTHALGTLYSSAFPNEEVDLTTLKHFFTETVELPKITWNDFIAELIELKSDDFQDLEQIARIYSYLHKECVHLIGIDKNKLKESFEDNPLIFVKTERSTQWIKASQCVWSSQTQLTDLAVLDTHYPHLKDFFVGFLDIKTLTARIIYDELKSKGSSTGSTSEQMKDLLWQFNAFLSPKEQSLNPDHLLKKNILPVRFPDGHVSLCSSETDFAIIDRKPLEEAFKGKLMVLDFSLAEVRKLENFWKWAGLENRYLSRSVKETTTLIEAVEDSEPISTSHRDLRRKAYALYRIAYSFGSPRVGANDHTLLNKLRGVTVFETDGISSQLEITQNGTKMAQEISRSELHISDEQSGFKIYVPKNAERQEACFYSKLPQKLSMWLMTEARTPNLAVVSAVKSVLTAENSALPRILELEGIAEVEVDDPDNLDPDANNEDEDEGAPETVGVRSTLLRTPASQASRLFTTVPHQEKTETSQLVLSPEAKDNGQGSERDSPGWSHPVSSWSPPRQPALDIEAPAHQSQPSHHQDDMETPDEISDDDDIIQTEDIYFQLLDVVIRLARRAVLPSQGPFNMSGMRDALQLDDGTYDTAEYDSWRDPIRLRSSNRLVRDMKIGAAGELYVFEWLSHLNPSLPSFSRENWQSTIRKFVTVHPYYEDMDPWYGQETADITYLDSQGVLTDLLIDKGYLESDTWSERRPLYYIEVKSTTGPCELPFFMSKSQFQRMKNLSNGRSGSRSPDAVYLIARVFDLLKPSIGFKLYIDPEVMKEKNELVFTAQTWSVKPGTGTTT